ncbi:MULTISPECIES: YhgE/Pip domain-containing protein [unclassified Streptomyces]|uniref:YhgE/Pip domain-containing protein n=1 Tax=unclassified Streptomyces TaxID=2593676 RepID=UPI0001C1A719|nr:MULTISPECIES: YhgE/Pip domain-containing protein [unclassified Streptomyces]AEN09446.1 YhgE/Pip C-terminal domain protein [Streptomyces sp. SirexAA-E]MYR64507.1 ABC transporter permease [Streptomyces sp. SID4939]MYS00117.1 ABC transporter permease [Streptomyces sp. SID4940]MYT64695.1 ABC transporter permease [Streptomyces sp. SID8357]MYT87759.1 ABC transporter permease [Streptomyces sp. SID8360]
MRAPGLAALELKRFGRGRMPRAALVALLLLPLLYGALYLWSFWDPYGRLDRIPVALVNDDKGTTADGERLAAGDEIADRLLDSEVFDWHEVSGQEAREGLEAGTYYLTLTMPSDFSRRIASSGGDSPETGALQVHTNDANNYIVGQISRSVFSEVRSAASAKTSRGFLDRIFINFSDLHDATAKAAKGADDLESGITKAKKGSKDLADGLKDAKSGSGKLSSGLVRLDKGAGDLRTGSQQVAEGTQVLADKVNTAAADVRPFLKDNGKAIGDTARLVADSSRTVRDNLDLLAKAAPTAAAAAHKASDDLTDVYRTRCEEQAEPDATVCPDLKRAKTAAQDVTAVADDVNTLVTEQNGDLTELRAQLAALEKQADALARRAPHLDTDLESAVSKINALNTGAKKVAKGADTLRTGLGTAKSGAENLDTGIKKLRTGATDLDSGLYRLGDGSATLAQGLNDGVGKIPDYDEKDRDARTGVMADPVRLASSSLHAAPNYGTGFAPYFIPLSLWVGAMVAYMLIQPLNRRALAVGAPSWRIAFAGWLPVAAIGLLQVVALMAVLHWRLGLEMTHAAGTMGFLALVTCCFAAIVQWLNARFGAAGRILVLAVLMLQLTSAGGTYPVQTSPGFFGAIHPYLPMTYVVDGLRRLITGGGLGPVWQGCVVLSAFTAGALALTALAARRKQVWTVDRLHPELTL